MPFNAQGFFCGKRLVIFGAGYVGESVAREALRYGMEVVALTRNAEKASLLHAAGARVIVGELASEDWHSDIPDGAEFALNCVSSGGGGIEGYRRSYLDGMRSVMHWAQGAAERFMDRTACWAPSDAGEKGADLVSAGVGTFIYTSSTSVYPQSGGVCVDESATTEGAGETARILLETEAVLQNSSRVHGASPNAACRRWFILRLAGIYGPGRHHLLDQLRGGAVELSGQGEPRLNLIHRDDIVAAVWLALSAPTSLRNEIFNLADDVPATKAELITWLAARLGRAVPRFTGESGSRRRVVTPDRVISNHKIKRLLDWQPRFADYRSGYEELLGA